MGADAHGLLVGGEGGHPRANVTVAFTDWFLPSIPRRFCLPAHRRVTHPAPDPPPPAPAIDGVCLLSVCQPAYCGDGAVNRVCNGAGKRFTSLFFWFWQACAPVEARLPTHILSATTLASLTAVKACAATDAAAFGDPRPPRPSAVFQTDAGAAAPTVREPYVFCGRRRRRRLPWLPRPPALHSAVVTRATVATASAAIAKTPLSPMAPGRRRPQPSCHACTFPAAATADSCRDPNAALPSPMAVVARHTSPAAATSNGSHECCLRRRRVRPPRASVRLRPRRMGRDHPRRALPSLLPTPRTVASRAAGGP